MQLYIQDVTLRDGMHAIRHQYSKQQIRDLAKSLDEAKVDAIEIAHGDGLSGGSFNYGFGAHTDWDWLEGVAEELNHAVLTTLLIPGIGTIDDLKKAYALGVRSVTCCNALHRSGYLTTTHRSGQTNGNGRWWFFDDVSYERTN